MIAILTQTSNTRLLQSDARDIQGPCHAGVDGLVYCGQLEARDLLRGITGQRAISPTNTQRTVSQDGKDLVTKVYLLEVTQQEVH